MLHEKDLLNLRSWSYIHANGCRSCWNMACHCRTRPNFCPGMQAAAASSRSLCSNGLPASGFLLHSQLLLVFHFRTCLLLHRIHHYLLPICYTRTLKFNSGQVGGFTQAGQLLNGEINTNAFGQFLQIVLLTME